MQKLKFSAQLLTLFSEYKYFSYGTGVQQLDSSLVIESRLGKKFVYHPPLDSLSVFRKIASVLNRQYLSTIPINQSATAYIEGKSYFDFIEIHRGNFFFLRIDIKDFFHSISKEIIRQYLSDYFSNEPLTSETKQSHLDAIVNFVTLKLQDKTKNDKFKNCDVLPIGFPLSPVISNIVFRRIDIILERMCAQHGITYSRYADDLLFSSRGKVLKDSFILNNDEEKYSKPFIHTEKFLESVVSAIRIDGFKINPSKLIKARHTISLNGYAIIGSNDSEVDGTIRVSNKKTKIIDKVIHEIGKGGSDVDVFYKCFKDELPVPKYRSKENDFINKYCSSQLKNKLSGYRSYLISMIKFHEKYNCFDHQSIEKYSLLIDKINNLPSKIVG